MRDYERGLTQDYLKSVLDYNSWNGIFKWKVKTNPVINVGDVAGRKNKSGYIEIGVKGHLYMAHRLAWLYMYGELPLCEIDHENTIKDDNKKENLRKSTRLQNSFNRGVQSNNILGLKGVKQESRSCFSATIFINKKPVYLGSFVTAELASEAYNKKAKEIHKEFYHDNEKS